LDAAQDVQARACSLGVSAHQHTQHRAAKLQGGLAFLGSHAAMIAAAKASGDDKASWRAAGLLLGAVWPWTVFVMLPLNKTILKQVCVSIVGLHQRRSSGAWVASRF
jgi:hypothetical protein